MEIGNQPSMGSSQADAEPDPEGEMCTGGKQETKPQGNIWVGPNDY